MYSAHVPYQYWLQTGRHNLLGNPIRSLLWQAADWSIVVKEAADRDNEVVYPDEDENVVYPDAYIEV